MIIQGSNLPIVVKFNRDVSGIESIEIHMYTPDGEELKHWSRGDVYINGNIVSAPITQEESMAFEPGTFVLEVKWLENGATHFTHRIRDTIVDRTDKTIMS